MEGSQEPLALLVQMTGDGGGRWEAGQVRVGQAYLDIATEIETGNVHTNCSRVSQELGMGD